MSNAVVFWSSCLSAFEAELTAQQFNTWIKPLAVEDGGDELRLLVPNKFVLQWVKDKFMARIQLQADEFFGKPVTIALTLHSPRTSAVSRKPDVSPAPPVAAEPVAVDPKPTSAPAPVSNPEPAVTRGRPVVDEYSRLNPNFTFDTFVTGKANQLARAAALQVAENPGVAYNPLFVYGGVGLGKTHLVQAIGNVVQQHNKKARIRYIHAEKYVGDVVKAYQHKAFEEFKRYYHSLDVLLIDDIQFFSGKNRTQEEFFYAFNALIEAHKQVIITCDTFPKEIENMEDRLISRFGWGLTVAIEPPELEMRVAILLKKAEQERVLLDENTAFFIAKHIRSNVRELEGALKRVLAYSRFTGQKVTLELAKEALKDLLAVQNRQVSVDNIQKTVADFYKIKVADMYSARRSRTIARPRQVAMALAKELTQLSLPDIGEAFGGRDHTTVLHACRKINELRTTEPEMAHDFNVLLQILKN